MRSRNFTSCFLVVCLAAAIPALAGGQPGAQSSQDPVISWISPHRVRAGHPDLTLGVHGHHFGAQATVYLNGSPLETDVESQSDLDAIVPASALAQPGDLTITVGYNDVTSNSKILHVRGHGSVLPVKITTSGLPAGKAGVGYQFQLGASGGTQPYHWSLSGALPGGMQLSDGGLLAGTPGSSGNFPLTIQVADSSTPTAGTASASFVLSIAPDPPPVPSPVTITTLSLPGGQVGSAYSGSMGAAGGTQPYHWLVLSGSLPGGVQLSDAGQFSGSPAASGDFPVTIQVTDSTQPSAQNAHASYLIHIAAAPPAPNPLSITTLSLPSGQVGIAYSGSVAATGGTLPYHWSVFSGPLPGGVQLSSGGQFSGSPAASGNFPVTIQVTDSTQPSAKTAQASYIINISPAAPVPVKITTNSLPSGQVGTSYSTQMAATGGTKPYHWSLLGGTMPNGLSLPDSGLLSGMPSQAGAFLLTIQVTDSTSPAALTDSTSLSINIATPPPPPSPGSGNVVIFFTDLESGPNTGGENNNGVFVHIYGKNFGASQGSGTITFGGGQVASYRAWGQNNAPNPFLDMIVVQLGPNAKTGNIVVHTAAGDSNGLPFTVRSGNIFFVSPSGSDSNPGTFAQPFATPPAAKNAMQAGDTTYFRAGTYNKIDDFGAIVNLQHGGTVGNAIAYVGYPGEVAFFDSPSVAAFYNFGSGPYEYIVIAELKGSSPDQGLTLRFEGSTVNHLRIVGNDLTCFGSCVTFNMEGNAMDHKLLGNHSHNAGQGTGASFDSRAYSFYYGGYGQQSDLEIAWNSLHDHPFGKCVQVYGHQAGDRISNFRFHDNACYNSTMPGLVLGGSDGGTDVLNDALIYNNLFWNNGGGATNVYGGIQIQSLTGNDGVYTIMNNTFYNNGAQHTNPVGGGIVGAGGQIVQAIAGVKSLILKNNIFYSKSSEVTLYFDDFSPPAIKGVTGSNNLIFGDSSATPWNSAGVNADPLFVNLGAFDFHLQSGSPARGAGINVGLVWDFDGVLMPLSGPVDIGALQFKH